MNEIQNNLKLEEEKQYWQDKVNLIIIQLLSINLNKEKENYISEKQINGIIIQKEKLTKTNTNLQYEITHLKQTIDYLKSEELKIKEDVIKMTEEKQNLEDTNIKLFESFQEKSNFVQNIEKNPNELINHLMTFDPETLNKLCLRLNNFHNENIYSQMIRMQQFYSQQYYMMQPNNFNN